MVEGKYLRALADLVLPRRCVVCGEILRLHERHICTECLSDLPLTYFWLMDHNPMSDLFNDRIQKGLPEGAPFVPYVHAVSLFFYNVASPYRQIPQHLKYLRGFAQGRFFASTLGRRLASSYLKDVDVIVPVPLHPLRRYSRGYNQAEVIARALAGEIGASVDTKALRRISWSRTQTKMSGRVRSSNVEGAFRVGKIPPGAVHVLIVDDVFTTGSTLYECWKVLRSALPENVRISVASLAFVQE